MAPPPSTSNRRGTSWVVVASRLSQVRISASPGTGGTTADVPVAITTARCGELEDGAAPGRGDVDAPLAGHAPLAADERDVMVVEPRNRARVVPVPRELVSACERGAGVE